METRSSSDEPLNQYKMRHDSLRINTLRRYEYICAFMAIIVLNYDPCYLLLSVLSVMYYKAITGADAKILSTFAAVQIRIVPMRVSMAMLLLFF